MKRWIGSLGISMSPGTDGKAWKVNTPLSFVSSHGTVTVRPGLLTDGTSIPRFFWRLIGPPLRGRYAPAAVIHDGLYRFHITDRRTADKILYEAMIDLGVKKWRAKAMYEAVRKFGESSWKAHEWKFLPKAKPPAPTVSFKPPRDYASKKP